MSVRIRLRRMGKKKQPHYRIVVADSRAPRDGRFVENLGHYNPLKHPAGLKVDIERVDYWIGEGAVPSATVKSLISLARSSAQGDVAANGAAPEAEGRSPDAAATAPPAEASAAEKVSEGEESAESTATKNEAVAETSPEAASSA